MSHSNCSHCGSDDVDTEQTPIKGGVREESVCYDCGYRSLIAEYKTGADKRNGG